MDESFLWAIRDGKQKEPRCGEPTPKGYVLARGTIRFLNAAAGYWVISTEKVMQFVSVGRYVANVVDGKTTFYGMRV
jgi:hypothetical protein